MKRNFKRRAVAAMLAQAACLTSLATAQNSPSNSTPTNLGVAVNIQNREVTLASATLKIAPLPKIDPLATHLFVWNDAGPIGWFEPIRARFDANAWAFCRADEQLEIAALENCAAMLFPQTFATDALNRAGAQHLFATITDVAPGNQSVWLDVGRTDGIAIGDEWLLELGQPAARFETVFVDKHRSATSVVPLVADLPLHAGDRVALWPGPADRRNGKLESAISYIDRTETDTRLWVPLPVGIRVPEETHIEILRQQEVIAIGILEKISTPFSHVRLVAEFAKSETENADAQRNDTLRIGDRVRVRTPADIFRRDYTPRVFSQSGAGYLINAGETESLQVGASWTVLRNGKPIGIVSISRVQRTYATILPDDKSTALAIGDAIQLNGAAPTNPQTKIGSVVEVIHESDVILMHELDKNAFDAHGYVAIQRDGKNVGVAIIIAQTSRGWIGVVLPKSKSQPIEVGDQLLRPGV